MAKKQLSSGLKLAFVGSPVVVKLTPLLGLYEMEAVPEIVLPSPIPVMLENPWSAAVPLT